MKRDGLDFILTALIAPIVISFIVWFGSFVISSYEIMAEVSNQKSDIQEIKADVKELLKRSN